MEPCSFGQAFPFVPPDVLCRIHDVLSPPTPLGTPGVPAAPPAPPGETVGPPGTSPATSVRGGK